MNIFPLDIALAYLALRVYKVQRSRAGFINALEVWPWNTSGNVAFETWQGTHWGWQESQGIPKFQTFHSRDSLLHSDFIQTKNFLCRMISPSFQLLWPRKLDMAVCNFSICAVPYFCICVCSPTIALPVYWGSIHQAGPPLPPSLQFATMSPQGGGGGWGGWVGGHLYGTPIARPSRDKSTPWQTKPPIASWFPFD